MHLNHSDELSGNMLSQFEFNNNEVSADGKSVLNGRMSGCRKWLYRKSYRIGIASGLMRKDL